MDKKLLEVRLAVLTQAITVAEREGDLERVSQLQQQVAAVEAKLAEQE